MRLSTVNMDDGRIADSGIYLDNDVFWWLIEVVFVYVEGVGSTTKRERVIWNVDSSVGREFRTLGWEIRYRSGHAEARRRGCRR